jgi:hypothetical protein
MFGKKILQDRMRMEFEEEQSKKKAKEDAVSLT